ncbi:MAG: Fic family protein [Nitrospinae bacterium]|nr:Fic family protein [Nitrospinota bacterium]
MKLSQKYDTSGLIEDQFEPGSRGRVLKNLLRIKKKREMDAVEAVEHSRVLPEILGKYSMVHRFTAKDICDIHKAWFGSIYPWAGQYRKVNISKGGFPFAAAKYVPGMMHELENDFLSKFTPCRFAKIEDIANAIAVVHVELVLIHPFRKGNGRSILRP